MASDSHPNSNAGQEAPEAIRQRLPKGRVGRSVPHESAVNQVTGAARFIDDEREPEGLLHAAVGGSAHAHARIRHLDLSAVRSAPGVVAVVTLDDVPGHRDIGPVFPGDPVLAEEVCRYVGQPVFAVAAKTRRQARQAVSLAKIDYEVLEPCLSVEQALAQKRFVRPTHQQSRGDAHAALQGAAHRLKGEHRVKGQEHLYLEGQLCMVEPTEEGGMWVKTSSQHPSEVQKLVAEVLNLSLHDVQVQVRRMGGAFGGKETQAAPLACIAALLAWRCKAPVKFRMSRRDDMVMTGKRHGFYTQFEVGFDDQGVIDGARIELAGQCGHSPDLSDAIVDRAMFHSDNAYYLNAAEVIGHRCETHTVSNTAFRGFGGPQGMLVAERMMDDIAYHLGEDPLTVRQRNLYGVTYSHRKLPSGEVDPRNETHYGQTVEEDTLPTLIRSLAEGSDYWARREEIKAFNREHPYLRRGLSLTPVKFGISFTVQHLNQAGALVHVYTDGSIHLNHGGTEMGQGLFTKVAQVVAQELQVDLSAIRVSATQTDKVPNTSPTAASSGSDLNGMAARDACGKIRRALLDFAAEHYGVPLESVSLKNNHLWVQGGEGEESSDDRWIPFADFVQQAYMARVPLSATGFYKTPKIHYDRASGKGRPFYYYANGAAVSEVLVDTLTGESRVLRVDVLHDAGDSLNPAIDRGQIEGGFVQGMGWLTTEEVYWDEAGRIRSDTPATYKIPTAGDTPLDFRVGFYQQPNREATVYRSKAVGEPPLMLAISVWSALRNAVASLADYRYSAPMDPPATPEALLSAIAQTQAWSQAQSGSASTPEASE